jgi:glycosyltransferase involved in cell wall biosynthesis
MTSPQVSVIMPVYNCENYVAEAIESILNQSFESFELLIIDDCSTDSTVDIINSYKNPKITLIKKPENTGIISSLNLGIGLSKGEFVARMDGDDISYRDRLAKQVDFLSARPNIVLCGTWYQQSSANEIIKNPITHEEIKLAMLEYCPFGHPTVMFRKQFIIDHNLRYDENFLAAEDYDLWTKMVLVGEVANMPQNLLLYRSHPNQISRIRQFDQVKNSNLCRIRMINYLIDKPSEEDIRISSSIIKNETIENSKMLKEILTWLDRIIVLNGKAGFYKIDEFKKYIIQDKAAIIRRFYLNTSPYNLKVLFEASIVKKEFLEYFTFLEILKFVVKCVIFWK